MPSGDVIKADAHGDGCTQHVKEMLLQREVTMPSGDVIKADAHGDECTQHVKEMLLQREVEIEVENMDKAGNCIGYLFVDNTNLSVHLVQEGFASMHFTAERGGYGNLIRTAEENAKNGKKKI